MTRILLSLIALLAWAASATPAAGLPADNRSTACTGDCDGDGSVRVDEIIRGVNIALGTLAADDCAAFDSDGNAAVTVDELVSAVNLALVGCVAGQRTALVVTTDFSVGSLAAVSLDEPRVVVPASPAHRVHPDAVARTFGGLVYVVNRFMGDSIQIVDPADDYRPVAHCLTGALSNPHDIAFVDGDKAYVSLFDIPELLIVDPTPGEECSGFIKGSIDLRGYADLDGLPESDAMAIVGDKLYLTLEKLDRDNFFAPSGPGSVLVIDIAADEIRGEIPLSSGNPFNQSPGIIVRDGKLLIGETNQFGISDGGIERVDLATQRSEGLFVTEAALGGDLTDFVLVSEELGYAVVSATDFTNDLISFDPRTGARLATLLSGGNYADIELNDRGELWVADSTRGHDGIRIFRASDGATLTDDVIDLSLPPFSILFLR